MFLMMMMNQTEYYEIIDFNKQSICFITGLCDVTTDIFADGEMAVCAVQQLLLVLESVGSQIAVNKLINTLASFSISSTPGLVPVVLFGRIKEQRNTPNFTHLIRSSLSSVIRERK